MIDDDVSLDELSEAVEHMHGVRASRMCRRLPSRFEGKPVWQGERESVRARVAPERDASVRVELRTEGTKRKFVAILGAPPLTDAVTAVRAYAMSATRTKQN